MTFLCADDFLFCFFLSKESKKNVLVKLQQSLKLRESEAMKQLFFFLFFLIRKQVNDLSLKSRTASDVQFDLDP